MRAKRGTTAALALVLMAVLTMACVPQAAPTQAPQPTPTAPRSAATPTALPGGVPAAALAAAQTDLAARLKIAETEIRLVRAEPVDWPDTSLGCPKAGMSYAQVIVPGFRLFMSAGQATYEYHADAAGHVATCG